MNHALEDFNDTLPESSESISNTEIEKQKEETPIVINPVPESKNHPKTAQHAFLIDVLGEAIKIQETTENALITAQKTRLDINQSFEEMEKSICEMNTLIEETIKKSGDKVSATLATKLDSMIQQMTAYQMDSLRKIGEFVSIQGSQLATESEKMRTKNVELARKEIEAERINATKEITVAINRVNGGNLIKPVVIFSVVFAVVLTIGISYLTVHLAVQEIKDNFAFATQAPAPIKHR